MSYLKEKLIPGYTGKFVIHLHDARHLHFDLRLEFPVSSLSESLKEYEEKRPEGKSPEPRGKRNEKSGNVLRSWAIPKHKLPTDKPLLATETEDHDIEYGSFQGIIPEGEYGAGKVTIYDHGTYKLLDADYDKKYVFMLSGKKIHGAYALIKTGGKQFLFAKVKDLSKYKLSSYIREIAHSVLASVVDYPRPTMCPHIWDLSSDPPVLRQEIKRSLIKTFNEACLRAELKSREWLKGLFIAGSITGYAYREDSDVDIDIVYDALRLREYPKFKDFSGKKLTEKLQNVFKPFNKKRINETPYTYSFMVLEPDDKPISDGVYNLFSGEWVRGPVKLPDGFDPDREFVKPRLFALEICKEIDALIGQIVRVVNDLQTIDQYIKYHDKINNKKIVLKAVLRNLCEKLDRWHYYIRSFPRRYDTEYPSYRFGPNWSMHNIAFKYLSRYGYSYPVTLLYERLKNNPYLELIDQFIPDD